MNRRNTILLTMMCWLLQGLCFPVAAQTNPKATIEAINHVIRTVQPAAGAEPLVEDLCKKFKKNPEVIVAIGEAFYQTADSARGKKYFRRVMEEFPNYVPAYIAAGAWAEDRYNAYDEAMQWYDQAIKANPKDSSGYIRYAKVLTKLRKPEEAAAKIKEITKHDPNFPVNLQIARIYSNLGRITEAADYYSKENIDNLSSEDLKDFATDCYLNGQFQQSLDIAKHGMEKFPRVAPMSRLALYNSVELKSYKEAVTYGEHLFTKTDNRKSGWQDLYYMALAYQGANKTTKAVEWFRKCTVADSIGESQRNNSYRNIAAIYKEMGEYDKASGVYDELFEIQKKANNVSAQDINLHARMYLEKSQEVNGEEVFQCYYKANELYELMAKEVPSTAGQAYYLILLNFQRMDPKFEQGLAVQPAQRVIDYYKDKKDLDSSEEEFYIGANWTLCYYYAITTPVKKPLVRKYGMEILRLRPEDSRPTSVFKALKIR